MTRVWLAIALAGALFGAGWLAHAIVTGPPPDVSQLLNETEAVAGKKAQEREARIRAEHLAQLVADSIKDADRRRESAALARGLRAAADSAERRTDAALDLLAQAGVVLDDVRLALAKERAARVAADFTALEQARQETQRAQHRAALAIAERDRSYRRVDSLTAAIGDLRAGLRQASRRGLDPGVVVAFDPGCRPIYLPRAMGGSVRVVGVIRAAIQVEARKC